jgi:hypothetical protein
MRKHLLYSQEQNMPVQWFEKYDPIVIKQAIVEHLKKFTDDTLEHCREFSKSDLKRFYGNEIINFYEVNPKNRKPSLVITKGSKLYYKSIEL